MPTTRAKLPIDPIQPIDNASARSMDLDSTCITGDDGSSSARGTGHAIAGHEGFAVTDLGVAIVGNGGRARTHDHGTSIAGRDGVAITGAYGVAIVGLDGCAAGGFGATLIFKYDNHHGVQFLVRADVAARNNIRENTLYRYDRTAGIILATDVEYEDAMHRTAP